MSRIYGGIFKTTFLLAIASLFLFSGVSADTQTQTPSESGEIKIGYLRCEVSSGWSYLVGSSRYLECNFAPKSGEPDLYHGELTKIGADLGYIDSGVIVWAVLAPSDRLGEGALSGHYAGVSVGATVGVGGGMNVLVGGMRSTITLQPVSVEGDVGLAISAGAVHLDLEPG